MQKHKPKDPVASLKHLSTQQLKIILSKLQNQHDILQVKNQEMSNQIADLRQAVKYVEAERKEMTDLQLQKKKQLESKIVSLEKGINYALRNEKLQQARQFKALME